MRGLTLFAAAGLLTCSTYALAGNAVVINEVDYDQPGTDAEEYVELKGPGELDLTGWTLVFHNGGSAGVVYRTVELTLIPADGYLVIGSDLVPNVDIIAWTTNGIQNGSPDGIVICDAAGVVVDAISYEGSFTAAGACADGMVLEDIGAEDNNSDPSLSVSRCPDGTGDFAETPVITPGTMNDCDIPTDGACCDETTGMCMENVTQEDCEAAGNRFGGLGSTCATIDPPCVPVGACCDEITGACQDGVSQDDCEAAGNRYGGDGSDCVTIDPPCVPAVLPANLMITEIVDGTLPGGLPKFVEITNCGAETVDLSGYSMGNFSGNSTELGGGAATQLMGILGPGEVYVVAWETEPEPPAISLFEDVYGFPPDLFIGPFINGDDPVALYFGQATGDGSDALLIDVYGVIGVDGTGQVWEYTDGYSYRNPGNTGTDTFDETQWFFGGANSLETGNDDEERILLQTLTTPGQHDCAGTLLISEIVDGTLPGGLPKWVEITNCGDVDLDLAGYSMGNYGNGGTDLGGGAATPLATVLAAGSSYVVAWEYAPEPPAISTFEDVYGFPPDLHIGPFINGDDVVALFFGQATGDGSDALMVDLYGVIGEDGSGTVWEYTDGYSRRLPGAGPNPAFDFMEWFIAGANALETGDDEEERQNLLDLTYPGMHFCDETCAYDIDASGDVGFADLLFILSNWGAPGGLGDLDEDGDVGYSDLLLVLSNWGPC